MIRILLVDDQKLIRQGLKALLELDPGIQVVGTASDGYSGIEQVEKLLPDVVLIDIRMPLMNGVTATRIISERFPETKVLILSGYDDEEYLADALRWGAKGYVLKDTPADDLVSVIRSVYKGYYQIGPGLLEKINSRIPSGSSVNSTPILSNDNVPNLLKLEIEPGLKNFEPNTLKELVRLCKEQLAEVEILDYINSLLEHQSSVAALYLAGALLSDSTPENQHRAFDLLKSGFLSGIEQGLSPDSLLLFYSEAVKYDAPKAFGWLTLVDAPWNNELGLSFLLQEANNLFGKTSIQYRSLLVLKQIRALREVGSSYYTIGEKVESIQQSLEKMGSLI